MTGAGRGIGRAYALLLGELGAKVVVNDLGASTLGTGGDAGPADEVVKQIEAAGGAAVANYADVSTVEGGKSVRRQKRGPRLSRCRGRCRHLQ